jgi:hypothetical protein
MPAKSAAPAPAAHVGPYRTHAGWHAAHAAAVGANRGNPTARAACTVATHLAWRAPGASVAWHKGTNAAMLAHCATLGISTGMPVHAAMALVVASLPAGPTTTALARETRALAPAGK